MDSKTTFKSQYYNQVWRMKEKKISVVLFSHSVLISLAYCPFPLSFPSLSFYTPEKINKIQRKNELEVMAHGCNPITLETEAGGLL